MIGYLFEYVSSFSPITILVTLLSLAAGLYFFVPWRSIYYEFQISECISDLETPADLRNEGRTKPEEIVTDDDLCETLRGFLKDYRNCTKDISKIADVITDVGIAFVRHSVDKDEGIE